MFVLYVRVNFSAMALFNFLLNYGRNIKGTLGILRFISDNNINLVSREIWCEDVEWIQEMSNNGFLPVR